MATYECKACGMSVNATCAKCNEPLENDIFNIGLIFCANLICF